MEVKLGKPALDAVSEVGMAAAWVLPEPPGAGMEASGEAEEDWVEISAEVELQPWPDRGWLKLWYGEDSNWPEHLSPPLLDGRMLVFGAPEDELEEAWAAVKARVETTNLLSAESTTEEESDSESAEFESHARLREAAQRRVSALE